MFASPAVSFLQGKSRDRWSPILSEDSCHSGNETDCAHVCLKRQSEMENSVHLKRQSEMENSVSEESKWDGEQCVWGDKVKRRTVPEKLHKIVEPHKVCAASCCGGKSCWKGFGWCGMQAVLILWTRRHIYLAYLKIWVVFSIAYSLIIFCVLLFISADVILPLDSTRALFIMLDAAFGTWQ